MPNKLEYLNLLGNSIKKLIEDVWLVFIIATYYRNFTQSADPDQTPRSAASDQGLHCLPMSLLWYARNKWVNRIVSSLLRHVCSKVGEMRYLML